MHVNLDFICKDIKDTRIQADKCPHMLPLSVSECDLILLEAGCKPNLDNVRLAALRVPQIQPILLHAASNAGSLKETCRKVIWRQLRSSHRGHNIQPGVLKLRHEIPESLLRYLQFEDPYL